MSVINATTSPVLLIELNEVNFEAVQAYVERGELPNLARLIAAHGIVETTSEQHYDELEPWIQWVTAHTGLSLAEHGVFRLGDIVDHDIPQIWEMLEAKGLRVGAISPMNAKNRLADPAFFVPDPWTRTAVVATPVHRRLFGAIVQAINDNARARLTARSAIDLAIGGVLTASPRNYITYAHFVARARRAPWTRALFLDLLLADLFVREVEATRPDFASLFLNAAAHIQHHYMFSSAVYSGELSNPDWYVPTGADPVLEVYRLYDRIIGDIKRRLGSARLMLATGLHQDPHNATTFYWRLIDPAAVLRQAGIAFSRIEPRMSRDFLVVCGDATEASDAAHRLQSIRAGDGKAVFQVDNRGSDLFVELIYDTDIATELEFGADGCALGSLRAATAFVAIKNGRHNGIGYIVDTGRPAQSGERVKLSALPERIMAAFGA